MKLPIRETPTVPEVVLGPRTVQCCQCNWEAVFILPEQIDDLLISIVQHIQQHGIETPQFQVYVH